MRYSFQMVSFQICERIQMLCSINVWQVKNIKEMETGFGLTMKNLFRKLHLLLKLELECGIVVFLLGLILRRLEIYKFI